MASAGAFLLMDGSVGRVRILGKKGPRGSEFPSSVISFYILGDLPFF